MMSFHNNANADNVTLNGDLCTMYIYGFMLDIVSSADDADESI